MSKMSDRIDLKDIERKAYTSYHEDGIIDLFIGLGILTMSLYVYAEMIYLMGAFVAVYIPIYMSMKKKITFPRLGQVTFSKSRTGRTQNSFRFLIAVNVIGVLAGFYFWWSFSGGSPPSWFPMFVEYFPIVIGAIGAGAFAIIAYITDITRFNKYAAVTLVTLGSAYFIPIPFLFHVAALGSLIAIAGYLQLASFKRKYPIVGEN